MQVRELDIAGSWEFTPPAFPDHRGLFAAPFQEQAFVEAVGHPMRLAQTNHSVSRRGTIRGVHFADVPPSQAKYVYCPYGALLDVIVDIRVGSPTFGQWTSVVLDSEKFNALYVSEGLGHSFIALADNTAMSYFCSEPFNPSAEHGITPMDPALGLPWPSDIEPILSDKDRDAPTLAEAEAAGLLPSYSDCVAYRDKLRGLS
ncbi:dTDP-4-dehydrorhamnose 3,5-epimerase family protein [Kutzneria kofuensis]|uniref:dTDP-4-dehydrorhamnose 3,5-epimerase n=1 Tax=Kutzneria kofuensis TaxID=103725 RepID=A0A7W9KKL6_9PSEU|nr:dTDP-4-dehydrorhamnose 3,5-epimerase [Kutzneria kofuensis]MBB5893614.1 dTDP-4-dehydrorhamnose 3,5-epimerase [Kutzneria kofuensis]